MVVCRYFLQGRCKYGAQCINEHPGVSSGTAMNGVPAGPRPGFHRNQSMTFAGPTATAPSTGFRPPRGAERGERGGPVRPQFSGMPMPAPHHQQPARLQQQPGQPIRPEDVIYHDLAEVQMQWPLGCYGLNCSWESGDNIIRDEYSPDELRCEAYAQWRSAGHIRQYEQTLKAVLEERRHLVEDLKTNLSRAVAMARTPRTYRLAAEEAQRSAAATNPSAVPKEHHSHAQLFHPHPVQHTQPVGPGPASIAAAPTLASRSAHSSQDFDSFTFGDIPELPPT